MSDVIRRAKNVYVVASAMGCCQRTVRRMLDDGRLEGYRVGKQLFVYLDSIEKYQRTNDLGTSGDSRHC